MPVRRKRTGRMMLRSRRRKMECLPNVIIDRTRRAEGKVIMRQKRRNVHDLNPVEELYPRSDDDLLPLEDDDHLPLGVDHDPETK